MRIREILSEGLSPVLYHATSFKSAGKMLTADTMRSRAEAMSFTRSLTGSYHKINRLIGIIFELDGQKLNMNYKGDPVGTEDYDWDTGDITHRGKDNKQLEDRIYTSEIKNLTKYIKSAIVYVPEEYLEHDTDEFEDESYSEQLSYAYHTVRLLVQNNIPHRYVTSESELANPKASNKELFSVIVSRETGNSAKLPEKYSVQFDIFKGKGEHGQPLFDETKVVITAKSFSDAELKAEELIFDIATKYDADYQDVQIGDITNQHGEVY